MEKICEEKTKVDISFSNPKH